MFMALVLSNIKDTGFVYYTLMYGNVLIIHRTWVQQDVVVMYSSSIVDKEIKDWFLLNQDIKYLPKNNPPLVRFLSSMIPTQSASV